MKVYLDSCVFTVYVEKEISNSRIIMELNKDYFQLLSLLTPFMRVDIDNYRAMNLYRRVGFKKTQGSISHAWKAEETR